MAYLKTPIPAKAGGIGFSSYVLGDMFYADTTTTLAKIAAGFDGQSLKINTSIPSWGDAFVANSTLTVSLDLTDGILTADVIPGSLSYISALTGDVAASGSGSAASVVAAVGGYQVAGTRNALLNGEMLLWQRGTSFTPAGSVTAMIADRWAFRRTTNPDCTIARGSTTPPAGFTYYTRLQRNNTTTGTGALILTQMVESIDAVKWAGAPVTLSFYARVGANYSASASGLGVDITTGTGTNENRLTGVYTGNATPISQTATLTTSFQRFSYTGTIAVGTTEFCPRFTFTPVGTAGAADYVDITGVQIEYGSTATPFEFEPINTLLERARRYYQKSFPQATAPAQNAGVAGATCVKNPIALGDPSMYIQFDPPMFPGTITFTTYNPSAGNANWRDVTAAADVTVSVDPASAKSETGILVATSGTVTTLGDVLAIQWSASAEVAGIV